MSVQTGVRLSILVLLTALCSEASSARGDNNGRGTKAVSLGNSFVSLADNCWAVVYNPAGLTQLSSTCASVFFVPQQFGLPELRTVAAAVAIPVGSFVTGLEVEQFGFDLYKETGVRFGLSSFVDEHISAGATLSLTRIAIDRYGSQTTATVDVGLLARVHENLKLGFSYLNSLGARVGVVGEQLPQVFLFGASYSIESIVLVAEIEKDIRYETIVKGGIEQSLFDFLRLRVGLSNNPDKFSGGFGLTYSNAEFGYAGYSHPDLGWTHQLEMSFVILP
ncbi:MAG: hypothetical protein AABZ41_04535 [Bacteroidota bacterium]